MLLYLSREQLTRRLLDLLVPACRKCPHVGLANRILEDRERLVRHHVPCGRCAGKDRECPHPDNWRILTCGPLVGRAAWCRLTGNMPVAGDLARRLETLTRPVDDTPPQVIAGSTP